MDPVYPVLVQNDGQGGLAGLQTGQMSGWHTGISLKELAALEFTKAHLSHLMGVECYEGEASRISEAVRRGWTTADAWMSCRKVWLEEKRGEPAVVQKELL